MPAKPRSNLQYKPTGWYGLGYARGSRFRERPRPYTTRLQKGGALVDDMRRILLDWDGSPGCAERIIQANVVSAPSRYRALDVVTRTFVPRFVNSEPPDLWRAVRLLEEAGWSQPALLPVHYYAAAAAE